MHLVDVSEITGRDPVEDFRVVMGELAGFSEDLPEEADVCGGIQGGRRAGS